jgi:hypothetical protein
MNILQEANNLKLKGNESYKNNNYEEAFNYFTEALKLVLKNQDILHNIQNEISEDELDKYQIEELIPIAILFLNRSNCFFHQEKFPDSLLDAQNCIKFNPGWYKGYYRKAIILLKINFDKNVENAIDNLKVALTLAKTEDEKLELKSKIDEVILNKNYSDKSKIPSQNQKKFEKFQEILKDESNENRGNKRRNKKNSKQSKNVLFPEGELEEEDNEGVNEDLKGLESDPEDEDIVQDQVDFLNEQFVKTYEDDAFRLLAIYHGVEDGELSIESARDWLKYAKKYGYGDGQDLFESLMKYVTTGKTNFDQIYDQSGIV